ncbi:type I-E CRISPR-associated protein Cas7/Cse4/CasC [Streptomyces indicus]|uniref:CRISPR system Cascade subunit CasC n=1 Tax=Streptomyces indicus TaxID=417292 RepID=A0A1G9BFV2_9ACTN|nr:type I-E CRISPR-associated protein Cas7/Cse4/CasC [Streptomyces indicus]SDK37735.1 CRISPR system Cascade subunit CasC [Streptomyces indicus]
MTATPRTILEIHALQSVPPSNINRDDTGSPKSAVYGGVKRARVSSQAWKRATREAFKGLLDPGELGVRTTQVVALVAKRITALDSSFDGNTALKLAADTLKAAGLKVEVPRRKADRAKKNGEPEPAPETAYLLFLSARQIDGLARLAIEGSGDITAFFKDKANKDLAKKTADTSHSVDVALFGRMVADSTDLNVDAAAQVAHAVSVHRAETETDYFTAVDDENEEGETGAGMIGTVDFNSSTLYRYAAVDVDLLERNLGQGLKDDEPTTTPVRRAAEAFTDAFISSLPSGKINTFGNHTVPEAVLVTLRTSRPISYVSAFEKAVVAGEEAGGHMEQACRRLAEYVPQIEKAYGDEQTTHRWVLAVGPAAKPVSVLGTRTASVRELVAAVGQAVAERLEQRG